MQFYGVQKLRVATATVLLRELFEESVCVFAWFYLSTLPQFILPLRCVHH